HIRSRTMHPEPVNLRPRLSHRVPAPRHCLRCVVTRMVRSTAIPLLILAGMVMTPTDVVAGSITYNVVNYPTLQDGFTVSGTITTNGAIGTLLSGTDITSWDITIAKGDMLVEKFDPSDSSNTSTNFDATPYAITVSTTPDNVGFIDDLKLGSIS